MGHKTGHAAPMPELKELQMENHELLETQSNEWYLDCLYHVRFYSLLLYDFAFKSTHDRCTRFTVQSLLSNPEELIHDCRSVI